MPTKENTSGTVRRKKAAAVPERNTARRPAAKPMAQPKRQTAPKTAAQPRHTSAATAEKRQPNRTDAPVVVYTPPIPFSRHRLVLRLLTVAAVVIALVFGLSIFFKVDGDKITVSGAEKYTAYEIRQASGIQDGDNLLGISDAAVSGKITAALPYVKYVRVGIKLPDTVHIDIVEEELIYSIKSQDGSWWLMNGQGRLIEQTDAATADGYTKIHGVQLDGPVSGDDAVAYEPPAETTDPSNPSAEVIPVTVTAAQKLQAAVAIIEQLEANGILGRVSAIQVDNISDLQLQYGQQYQVKLGDSSRLDYKIEAMKKAISQMSDYQTGILDVSKASPEEGVVFSPGGS